MTKARRNRPILFWPGGFTLSLLLAFGTAHPAPKQQFLDVFAAASLSDAFAEIAREFERGYPGLVVRLNLAGSNQLALQIEQGAPAAVFASADQQWMDYVRERGLLEGEPSIFARNRLVAIVPRTNPARIDRLEHLARPGIKLVLTADAVPAGRYSRQVLQRLSTLPSFGPSYAKRVLVNVVSDEDNVRSVVAKVQLGEADAGLVYASDITASVARYVRMLTIPDSVNAFAAYPIALVKQRPPSPSAASAFVERVLSPEGQRILRRHGFLAATPAP